MTIVESLGVDVVAVPVPVGSRAGVTDTSGVGAP
jgi:hypothetical protein